MNTKISYLNDEVLGTISGGGEILAYNEHVLVGYGDLVVKTRLIVGSRSTLLESFTLVAQNSLANENAPNVYLDPPKLGSISTAVGFDTYFVKTTTFV